MGALHVGHAALIREAVLLRARERSSLPVIVSIFVNPTQFNEESDLARYPRTLESDSRVCGECGADAVYVPDESEVYPPETRIVVPTLPYVATSPRLEDATRPGHFAGVCQVVARLFELVRAHVALFGEKDWQQFKVIEAMVASSPELRLRPRVVGVPTVREADGLAMSSRNVFLTPADRSKALAISRSLHDALSAKSVSTAEQSMSDRLSHAGLHVEYAVVRDAQTLLPFIGNGPHNGRALIAARVGSVRLIDNTAWPG